MGCLISEKGRPLSADNLLQWPLCFYCFTLRYKPKNTLKQYAFFLIIVVIFVKDVFNKIAYGKNPGKFVDIWLVPTAKKKI